MFRRSRFYNLVAISMVALLPSLLCAETVAVPHGTRVFLELDQDVVSKKTRNQPGSYVKAHVWSDVKVDGHVVVEAGTPAIVQVGRIKGAKVAGIKGKLEIKALSVEAADGRTPLLLEGGYNQLGRSRMALSVALAVVIFVPLIFIPGKNARLRSGTVFDATVANTVDIEIEDAEERRAVVAQKSPLSVEIFYDELDAASDGTKPVRVIPLRITFEGDEISEAKIVRVNEDVITPIPIDVAAAIEGEQGLVFADASVNVKPLSKHLSKGYNELTFEVAGATDTVLLDLEL